MLTDTFLNNVARAITNQTYKIPAYFSVGTSAAGVTTADTILAGEIGTRQPVSGTLSSNQVSYEAIRSAASVIATSSGDVITLAGLSSNSSGAYLMEGMTLGSSLTQTTNFDLDFNFTVTFNRG